MIFIAVLLPFLEQLENDRKVRENEAVRQLAVAVCDVAVCAVAVADAFHVYEAGGSSACSSCWCPAAAAGSLSCGDRGEAVRPSFITAALSSNTHCETNCGQ